MLTLMLISVASTFFVHPTLASGTVYIRADGSIDPPTALISSIDNVTYTFTDDIYDSIVVERNNIVIDGAGHTLQGGAGENGFFLNNTYNVAIKRTNIKNFETGILLLAASGSNIFENNVTGNSLSGIFLIASENNSIYGNTVTNNWIGIGLEIEVNYNTIIGNKITNNSADGIFINDLSNNNTIIENYVADNAGGIYIGPLPCSGNLIFHNNFINNTNHQALIGSMEPSINTWDDGYPSGGNYWSDYLSRYSGAQELDDSGIWDTPYTIDENNQDNYPLMEPWGAPPITIPTTIAELKAKIIELGSEGEISNRGTVNSLISKLNIAQKFIDTWKIDAAKTVLAGFISRVEALSGTRITMEAANILIESAQYIISHL